MSKTLELARETKALADLVTLPPGGAVEAVETIGFDVERELPAFSAPGRYEIRATLFYENYEKQLGSNPLVVDVREPTGVDAEAWAFVVANGLARFLGPEAHLFSPTEATVGALRELAERFEKSAYAPFAETGFEAICTSTSETQVPPGCPPRVTCGGDCDTDGAVSPAEVAVGVRALFDRRACRAADRDEDGVVRANEILAAVWNLAVGCGEPAPAAQAAQTK
ncbi:MAG: hypothetical protein KatS3mg076_1989 [Candidatus Binatia bacterium]|nr:MAG: hypothetical protein KatS3mg076_1989 [Candidatus Binatia bacterium]